MQDGSHVKLPSMD